MNEAHEEKKVGEEMYKALTKKIDTLTENIDLLIELMDIDEKNEGENMFDPNETAEMFDRPDITLRQYFEAEGKNLDAGIELFKGNPKEEEILEKYDDLMVSICRVFKPEKFISYSIVLINNLLNRLNKLSDSSKDEERAELYLENLTDIILDFNSYMEKNGMEIQVDARKKINDLNKSLKFFSLPLIQI
ncbi:MAG: hypothetical protein WCQ00_03470 [bacterium]